MTNASKRILSLYMLFTACFMAILVRIVYINYSSYAAAGESRSTRTVVIGTSRGKIYDRNKELLVDNEEKLVAAVTPSPSAQKYLAEQFDSDVLSKKIEEGYPFVTVVKSEINNELIKTFSVPVRYGEKNIACHIVGYTDYSGKGVTGIENAFEKVLSRYSGKLSVGFETDALGRVLAGMDKNVKNENYNSQGGVLLTLDSRIQQLTEDALAQSKIKSGCAVVMHIDTGDIEAVASVPDFDRNNVEAYLQQENSPLMNKALSAYSAGSVFKSVVAAFALESGIDSGFTYNCTGSVKIGDKIFTCPAKDGHGKLDLSEALQQSCNLYFINLMDELDCEKFIGFCKKLGFGKSISLCEGIESDAGIVPDEISLSIPASRANVAFGQGDLMVTPLHMVKAYHALATGFVVEPKLIYGFCDEKGNISAEKGKSAVRILSDTTVKKMKEMLFNVTEKGIATNAKSDLMKLAGKTGTAQSGSFSYNGEEFFRTWFVGFYPADNPHYIVAVMNENGQGGNLDCAPVFKNICEWIACDSLRR